MEYLLCVLLTLAMPALGATQDVTLDWTEPATLTDGTPLPVADIDQYTVYYTVDSGAEQVVVVTTGSSQVVSMTLDPRVEQYVMTAEVTATAYGRESGRSNMVVTSFVVTSTAVPGVPTNVTFTITCNVGCNVEVQP